VCRSACDPGNSRSLDARAHVSFAGGPADSAGARGTQEKKTSNPKPWRLIDAEPGAVCEEPGGRIRQ
jgi:hypothetical protein